jgi:hypothetical protein
MKRRPKIGLLGWVFRVSLMAVPALFVAGVVHSQSLGEAGDYGTVQFGGGTISSNLTIPAGAANTPSLNFTGSTTTGLWAASSTLWFVTNGADRAQISSGGTFIAKGAIGLTDGNSYLQSPSSGVIKLSDNADADFSRLQLGGTTSSFPAIKKSSATTVGIRLADDSGGGALEVAGSQSANAQTCTIDSVSSNVTLNTGSTTTNGPQIPVDAIVMDVTARVTTTITTAVSWSVGVGGATTRYVNANATMTAGTTATGLDNPRKYTAATNTVITTNANPGAGAIRITIHYMKATAPTS